MLFPIQLLLISIAFLSQVNHSSQNSSEDDTDPGEALYLTPLINEGKIDEARKAAEFSGDFFATNKGYSGYITINDEYNSNLFFLYFPAKTTPECAPIIVWLDGGPGASSVFFGIFIENGPLVIADNNLTPRNYSWNSLFNMIYIDSPPGAGFSYTENEKGYAKTDLDFGKQVLDALKQIYKIFPEFQELPLYVAGTSYAGKFVTALGYSIYKDQQAAASDENTTFVPMNFSGLAIGNGLVDPLTQFEFSRYLYDLGLIDINDLGPFQEMEAKLHKYIREDNADCMLSIRTKLWVNEEGFPKRTVFHNLTGYNSVINFAQAEYYLDTQPINKLFRTNRMRKLLHAGNNVFGINQMKAYTNLRNSMTTSVAPLLAEILNHYRVCIYTGQFDLTFVYRNTIKYIRKLKFNGAKSYQNSTRQIWRVDGELAGYANDGGNLTTVLIRNAGHLASFDEPKWTLDMIRRFINNERFGSDSVF